MLRTGVARGNRFACRACTKLRVYKTELRRIAGEYEAEVAQTWMTAIAAPIQQTVNAFAAFCGSTDVREDAQSHNWEKALGALTALTEKKAAAEAKAQVNAEEAARTWKGGVRGVGGI